MGTIKLESPFLVQLEFMLFQLLYVCACVSEGVGGVNRFADHDFEISACLDLKQLNLC